MKFQTGIAAGRCDGWRQQLGGLRKFVVLATAIVVLAPVTPASGAAAEQSSSTVTVTTPAGEPDELQEVTVTAQHPKLDWAQRNALVQKAATFVYGITSSQSEAHPARWNRPVCAQVTGLPARQSDFIIGRVADVARSANAGLASGEHCRPNLLIWVTQDPRALLHAMETRHYAVSFGNAAPSQVAEFIHRPGPVWTWHNTYRGALGPVFVVIDRPRLRDVSLHQLADYVAMVSLLDINSDPHLGDAPTILRLFDGAPKAAPEGLSDWDQTFLKVLYSPTWSLAKERSLIARRMIGELIPP